MQKIKYRADFAGGGAANSPLRKGFVSEARHYARRVVKREETVKQAAFTLAEVLITLGIIGVVAALTLPTLIQNYKRQEVVNKLKANVSIFQNAIKMAEVKHGFISDWESCNYESETDNRLPCTQKYFDEYIKPELKILKACMPTSAECWTPAKYISGTSWLSNNTSWANNAVSAILSNGTSFYLWYGTTTDKDDHIQIWIDLDGPKKGRNTVGADVFGIILYLKASDRIKQGLYIVGSQYKEALRFEDLRNNSQYGCSGDASVANAGYYCGALIQANGWEIPEDYPIKF